MRAEAKKKGSHYRNGKSEMLACAPHIRTMWRDGASIRSIYIYLVGRGYMTISYEAFRQWVSVKDFLGIMDGSNVNKI